MNEIVMYEPDKRSFQKALDYCKEWGAEHQAEVGVVEIALGAGLIAWGLQSGHIQMGVDVVASKLSDGGLSGGSIGGATGAGLGGIGGSILGSIGIVGAGTAVGIPALAVIGGGAAIAGLFGNEIGEAFSTPPGGFGDFFFGASIIAVGTALMIDGARRIVKDERILKIASKVKDGTIYITELTTDVVAKNWDELQSIINELAKHPDTKDVALGAMTGTTAVAGAAIGGGLAAGSITVLGSHGLGAAALSLGLVSAPIWPIVAGGVAGLAIGLATWKGVQHYRNKQNNDLGKVLPHGGLLPNPDKT